MNEYDIVVVGGGPAGSSAARMAAEKGARTIMLEEHSTIGLPEHCVGLFSPTLSQSSREFMEELVGSVDRRAVVSELKGRRIYSPSGKVKEVSLVGTGTYLIDRGLFDLELGKQAGNAGAEIMLNTKVTDLIREDGFIKGVITNSRTVPKIHAKS